MSQSPLVQEEQQSIAFPPEKITLLLQSSTEFFNGETLEETLASLNDLRNTTITESYGELDKSDKWFMIDLFNRLQHLISRLHAVCSA